MLLWYYQKLIMPLFIVTVGFILERICVDVMSNILDRKTLQALREIEDEYHPMGFQFCGAMFGSRASMYGVSEDDLEVGIQLDTDTGEFCVFRRDKDGDVLEVDRCTKLYKLMMGMVDLDILRNEHSFCVNLPDWLYKLEQEYLASCPSIEDCMDSSGRDVILGFVEDINHFKACADNLAFLSASIAEDEKSVKDIPHKLYESLRDYINAYQIVFVEAGELYECSEAALHDDSAYFADDTLECIKYLNERFRTIVYTESLFGHVLEWYNEFLSRASGGEDPVISRERSAFIVEAVNTCFDYINRLRSFFPALDEIRNRVLYEEGRA